MDSNKICRAILGSSFFIVGGIGFFSTANLIQSASSSISRYLTGSSSVSPVTVISIIMAVIGLILMISSLFSGSGNKKKDHIDAEMEALRRLNPFNHANDENDTSENK